MTLPEGSTSTCTLTLSTPWIFLLVLAETSGTTRWRIGSSFADTSFAGVSLADVSLAGTAGGAALADVSGVAAAGGWVAGRVSVAAGAAGVAGSGLWLKIFGPSHIAPMSAMTPTGTPMSQGE